MNSSAQLENSINIDTQERRIFVVAQHNFSVDGLISILEAHKSSHLVSCVEPGDACIQKFSETRPELLIIHNDVVEQPAEEFFGRIYSTHPDVRILVFGQSMTDDYVYDLVKAGAHGYINEKMSGDHLIRALDEIQNGGLWIERHIAQRFVSSNVDFCERVESIYRDNIEDLSKLLTEREKEVLKHVLSGMTTKDIAERISVSHQCVKLHLGKLFRKFDVSNRPQLIITAMKHISPISDFSDIVTWGLGKPEERRAILES